MNRASKTDMAEDADPTKPKKLVMRRNAVTLDCDIGCILPFCKSANVLVVEINARKLELPADRVH